MAAPAPAAAARVRINRLGLDQALIRGLGLIRDRDPTRILDQALAQDLDPDPDLGLIPDLGQDRDLTRPDRPLRHRHLPGRIGGGGMTTSTGTPQPRAS